MSRSGLLPPPRRRPHMDNHTTARLCQSATPTRKRRTRKRDASSSPPSTSPKSLSPPPPCLPLDSHHPISLPLSFIYPKPPADISKTPSPSDKHQRLPVSSPYAPPTELSAKSTVSPFPANFTNLPLQHSLSTISTPHLIAQPRPFSSVHRQEPVLACCADTEIASSFKVQFLASLSTRAAPSHHNVFSSIINHRSLFPNRPFRRKSLTERHRTGSSELSRENRTPGRVRLLSPRLSHDFSIVTRTASPPIYPMPPLYAPCSRIPAKI